MVHNNCIFFFRRRHHTAKTFHSQKLVNFGYTDTSVFVKTSSLGGLLTKDKKFFLPMRQAYHTLNAKAAFQVMGFIIPIITFFYCYCYYYHHENVFGNFFWNIL